MSLQVTLDGADWHRWGRWQREQFIKDVARIALALESPVMFLEEDLLPAKPEAAEQA